MEKKPPSNLVRDCQSGPTAVQVKARMALLHTGLTSSTLGTKAPIVVWSPFGRAIGESLSGDNGQVDCDELALF
jgi:hypothetical protein